MEEVALSRSIGPQHDIDTLTQRLSSPRVFVALETAQLNLHSRDSNQTVKAYQPSGLHERASVSAEQLSFHATLCMVPQAPWALSRV